MAYSELTSKKRNPSTWRANIEAKMAMLAKQVRLLTNHRADLEGKYSLGMTSQLEKLLKSAKVDKGNINEIVRLQQQKIDLFKIYEKKIRCHESRKAFRRENNQFEYNRQMFYRKLTEGQKMVGKQAAAEMASFWGKIWKSEPGLADFDALVKEEPLKYGEEQGIINLEAKLVKLIERLPNWKTPGVDKVSNFFIKKLTVLHKPLIRLVEKAIVCPGECPKWFFSGVTYLIPKVASPEDPNEYRPITCMSNLYKLVTKLVAQEMRNIVELNGILSENQLGTRRECQGAKEQALINKSLNTEHKFLLKSMWIDIKKAYDSVNHDYLKMCLRKLGMPDWCTNFVDYVVDSWSIQLSYNQKVIGKVDLERGILQGDSLSPLLFVLCMEPLSRLINATFPALPIEAGEEWFRTNHLLFIDDIKLFVREEETLKEMMSLTSGFLKKIGLVINDKKSATKECKDYANLLEEHEGYKYLGVLEDRTGRTMHETKKKIVKIICDRAERLCKSKLNAENLFWALNEHALSLLNYYVGLVEFEHEDLDKLDQEIRKILRANRIHYQAANTERLYIPRSEMGRGLTNAAQKGERILVAM